MSEKVLTALAWLVFVVANLAIPSFAVMAYRGWARGLRGGFSVWRNAGCAVAIASTVLSWLWYHVAFISYIWQVRFPLDPDVGVTALGVVSAFFLKGAPRAQVLFAGLLMVAQWVLTINV